jgi:hypothetical protein
MSHLLSHALIVELLSFDGFRILFNHVKTFTLPRVNFPEWTFPQLFSHDD